MPQKGAELRGYNGAGTPVDRKLMLSGQNRNSMRAPPPAAICDQSGYADEQPI